MKTETELLAILETYFYIELQGKTSWGRNEVKEAFQRAVKRTLMKALEDTVQRSF